MKKVLLVVALLLLATPVFAADVTVTATVGSVINPSDANKLVPVTIGWTGAATADAIRAFALVLNADSGTNLDHIRDFNKGESTKPNGGYGIFPARFRQMITVLNSTDVCTPYGPGYSDSNYNPLAWYSDPNSGGGNDNPNMVVELGTLFKDANAPGTSGTLFVVDVNSEGKTDCNLCISLDQIRGGVVKKDTTAADVCLPSTGGNYGCIKLTWGPIPCTEPNVVGMTRAAAKAALEAAGYVVNATDVNGWGGAGVSTVGNVYQQSPIGSTVCGTTITLSVVSYPIKATAPIYANWVTLGKPACWAYPRQCRGDADGKKQGIYWVSANDLTILRGAISKALASIPPGGRCADFDHNKQGIYWISANDLNILRAYISKAEASVPICGNTSTTGDPNFWYWCLPTTAVCPTSPAGQVCAPVGGACPNTP